jgi:hypothetical protein
MKTAPLFMPASCCDSLTLGLNGTDGLSSSSCCLIIIVSIPISPILNRTLDDDPVVMTKPKEKDGITKYNVNRRVSDVKYGIL